jgi:hypothetical protein
MSRSTYITRSPSTRRLSSIRKDEEKLSVDAEEIDEMIMKWDLLRRQSKELREKEQKYRKIIARIMDLTESDVIKGKDLSVTRRHQRRTFLTKANVPPEIYQQYGQVKEIVMFYIKEL